jgi:hypothetical protein
MRPPVKRTPAGTTEKLPARPASPASRPPVQGTPAGTGRTATAHRRAREDVR